VIPVKLVLEDFLSFASPEPIDFTTFDVACLTGNNGAGKSSLLDGLTFALFGAARGCEGGQNQDRLIRDGADETHVEFTFLLGGSTYRITRHRTRAGKGEIHFVVGDGENWKNIAGETLRATEAKIASVLRMDYRTFTASAFFVQGRSEDFLSRMSPNERKEVFARLLDLGVYDDLEEAARTKARDAERHRKEVHGRIEQLEASLPDLDAISSDIAGARKKSEQVTMDIERKNVEVSEARAVVAGLERDEAVLAAERATLATLSKDAAAAREFVASKTRDLELLDTLLARADEAKQAVDEAATLREAESGAQKQQQAAAALDVRRAALVATIEGERRALEDRRTETARTIAKGDAELKELAGVVRTIAEIDERLEGIASSADAVDEVRAQLQHHEIAGARLQEQQTALSEKLTTATEALQVLGSGGGECPVCGSALDAAHRAQAKKRLQAEIKTSSAAVQTARAGIETEKKEAKRLREDLRRLEAAVVEREKLVATREGLSVKVERRRTLEEELNELRTAVAEIETALRDELFATELRTEAASLELKIGEIYDEQAHSRIRARLVELEPYAALAGRIEEAQKQRAPLAAEIEGAHVRVGELDGAVAEREAVVERLTSQISALEDARSAVAEAESMVDGLQTAMAGLVAEIARLEERDAAARRTASEIDASRTEERSAATEHRRYRRLVEAFGRGGIPDLIIDNALPELEDDANQILGRLSDHEMSVHFVLQRDTKSGKAKDTFEALVHHDGGVRDFAMFSGGEAFRVAFAVRLAMSKLLVRRSGARLETLVIDEGFGTQDPEGRQRLIEAINLARAEFGKVLVITHLDDLKDQFGTQIAVTKGPEGSVLQVTPG
jgi:DNA repair protein SbcC/Rad50